MVRAFGFVLSCILVVGWVVVASGQDLAPGESPTAAPDTQPADEIAATVDGFNIMESDVDALLRLGTRNQPPNPQMYAQMRQRFHDQIVAMLVDSHLLDEQAAQAGVKIGPKDLEDEVKKQIAYYCQERDMTEKQFEEMVQTQYHKSVPDFVADQVADPRLRTALLQSRLIAKQFPEAVKVSEAEVKEYYEANVETRFKRPERVRASHILIDTRQLKTDEEKAEAKKKAEMVLAEAKKAETDAAFGKLAEQYSACPSKAHGGDLGFFHREAMVKPFADAAFSLKPGEMSDLVETQFGYHIIRTTDHKAAETVTLEAAAPRIADELEKQKMQQKAQTYIAELKAAAKVTYPPGKEPATRPAFPTTRPTARVSTRPAMRITPQPAPQPR